MRGVCLAFFEQNKKGEKIMILKRALAIYKGMAQYDKGKETTVHYTAKHHKIESAIQQCIECKWGEKRYSRSQWRILLTLLSKGEKEAMRVALKEAKRREANKIN